MLKLFISFAIVSYVLSLRDPLSVLMLSTPFPGHVTPTLALGEELVRRGHKVTLCTTVMAGSKLTEIKAERAGVEFLSAGESYFATYHDYQQTFKDAANGNFSASYKIIYFWPEVSKRVGLAIDYENITRFDLIVATEFLAPLASCLTRKWNVTGLVLSTTFQFQPHHFPPWPYPPYMSKSGDGSLFSSDDMSFLQRLITVPFLMVFNNAWKLAIREILYYDGSTDCSMIPSGYAFLYPGVYAPQIVQTVLGFEYPRPQSPLSHYVGPLLSKNADPIPGHLQTWLNSKQNQSVVLVSMGSTVTLTEMHARSILEAAAAVGYDVVWSLRKSNQHIMDGLSYSGDHVMISEWLPQLSVVQHPSIGVALLHGGLNSVNEALYYKVPVIAVPFINDQGDVAVRLQRSRAGIMVLQKDFCTEKVTEALSAIKSGK